MSAPEFRQSIHSAECIEQHLQILRSKLRNEMAGRAVITKQATILMKRIDELEVRLEEALHPTQAPLSQLLADDPEARKRIYRLLVKVPVAADLLYDVLVELQGAIRKLGVTEVTISEAVVEARRAVEKVVFMVDTDSTGFLTAMLEQDVKLIEHQSILLDRFITEHFDNKYTEGGDK